ncbi:MAG: glucose-1-phosphate thymidylyltransferase, partial [Proteobacteria bacterium]|nr:glucose-1-phosphate thymidylyltransferase [Pseudomonadota bacterium]
MSDRVGIVLAGGKGTRLLPLTKSISKQLLPVYDKPMIFYPLYTLKQFKIKEVLIICMPDQLELYKQTLGDGSEYEMSFTYKVQDEPRGLADAFIIGEEFINKRDVVLILGDNIFIGNQFINDILINETIMHPLTPRGNYVIGYKVKNPKQYGVFEFYND